MGLNILDCESRSSTYLSIKTIFGVDRNSLDNFFENIEKDYGEDINGFLLLNKLQNFTHRMGSFDSTCWFHLTRVHPESKFLEGILPQNDVLPRIWAFLYSLVESKVSVEEWNEFKQKLEDSSICGKQARNYHITADHPDQWGPNGSLILEIALNSNHTLDWDYLRLPEIVSPISICFQEEFKIDLEQLYIDATKPCVVKFIDASSDPSYVATALFYLYWCRSNDPASGMNSSFDGQGEAITVDKIQKVKFYA